MALFAYFSSKMNKPVTLFVIPFLLVQVRSATIPANVGENGGEGLEDLSQRPKRMDEATRNLLIAGEKIEELGIGRPPRFHRLNELRESNPSRKTKRCPRYYLTGNPHFQNTIVGASLKRNLEKLCLQCKESPICRVKGDCEHCVKYCEPYGTESKTSAEEVGIAREPENDVMRNEADRDMTLVSRFANGNGMAEDLEREEPNSRLQMIHNPMAEEEEERTVVGSHLDTSIGKDDNSHQNHQDSRYYTVGIIKPGLLMNIMLKLINIKQTNDMEKVVILVKSKKYLPITVGVGEKYDIEFLKMLGRELETAEKIHGGSPLEAKDINKILETAYEKAEFKSKTEAQIVSESDDSIPMIPSEQITRFDDKIVSSAYKIEQNPLSEKDEDYNQSPPTKDYGMIERNVPNDNLKEMQDKTNTKLRNNNPNVNMNIPSQNRGENLPQAMSYVGSANLELSEDSEMKPQQDVPMEHFESKLESKQDLIDMDSESDEALEENEKARTLHHKKYKKKKKKGHMNSYSHSYGNYGSYGYRRSNDDHTAQEEQQSFRINQATNEALTGSQQEGLRPLNEDRIGAKDDFQRDQKGLTYKGQGGLENSKIVSHQENLRAISKDRIEAKDDSHRDLEGATYSTQGDLIKSPEEFQKSNIEEMTGSQQESLRPKNEDRIGAKDDFQRDQKGFIYKGLGGLLKDQPKFQKTRTNDPLMDEQDERLNVPDPTQDFQRDSGIRAGNKKDAAYRSSDGIAQIHLSEQNKKLDPKKVSIAQPNEDSHDGMPDPFHTRIHAHFSKIQEYFDKQSNSSTEKNEPIVSMTESSNLQNFNDDNSSKDIQMKSRNNEEDSNRQLNMKTENLKMADSRETQEMLSDLESSAMKKEPIDDDMPKVGINNVVSSQMAKQEGMKEETSDDMEKVGLNIEPQDLIILQKEKGDNSNSENLNSEGSSDLRNNIGDVQISKAKSAENFDGEFSPDIPKDTALNDNVVTDDLKDQNPMNTVLTGDKDRNPMNRPQFTTGDKNLPGQTVIQVDDQLIDVPNEGKSIFQVNSQPIALTTDEDGQEQENIFINEPTRDIEDDENVGAMKAIPSENLRVNPQIMVDQSGQNLGLSANRNDLPIIKKHPFAPSFAFKKEKEFRLPKIMYTGNEDTERSSTNEKKETDNEDHEFPTPNKSPIKKHPFAPAFEGFRSPKIIQTAEEHAVSELSSSTDNVVGMTEKSTENMMEIVGDKRAEYENAIEKKIEKLMTPREQEFLHNFGKIVPSIEKMHLNSKSDIYFTGNGIKLPLKMSPNKDGSISLSVDLEKLCKCENSTCSHKMDMINKLDGNLINISNNVDNSQVYVPEKHDSDMYIENTTEKKIRKPRNHMDLSKLYKTYRKKYHRLHRRSVSNEYFRRFKEIEQSLEKKLDQLNENVKKSNREYDNMLRKGTKDLLQIKEEDQVVKQRIELVNDLLQWMKEMASEVTKANDKKSNSKEFFV